MPKPMGNCYEMAACFMLDIVERDSRGFELCHGTVIGTGGQAEGWQYGHAWVELGRQMIFNFKQDGTPVLVPDYEMYYRIGQVRDVQRYSRRMMSFKMVEYNTYGPWHDQPTISPTGVEYEQ